jgi:hypothetical protein
VTTIDVVFPVYTEPSHSAIYTGATDTLYSDLDATIELIGALNGNCKYSFTLVDDQGALWSNNLITVV